MHIFFIVLLFFFSIFSLKAQHEEDTLSNTIPVKIRIGGTFYSTPIKTLNNHVVIASHNRTIHLFDNKGNEENTFKTRGWIHATPTQFSDSSISIGCYDGYFYFFDPQGNYKKKIKPQGFIFTEPVEIGNYIAFGNNWGKVVFYDPDKEEISYLKVKGIVHGSPMVTSDSILIIGSNSHKLNFINTNRELICTFKTKGWIMHSKPYVTFNGNIIVGSYDRHLYALNKEGKLVWKYQTKGRIHSSPIQMPDSTIVFGSFDGSIYLLSQTGDLIKQIQTKGKVISSPAQINDSLFVIGSYDHHLYIISTSGVIYGTYNAGGMIFSSPIVLDCGSIFCCTTNGILSFIPPNFIHRMLETTIEKDENRITLSLPQKNSNVEHQEIFWRKYIPAAHVESKKKKNKNTI